MMKSCCSLLSYCLFALVLLCIGSIGGKVVVDAFPNQAGSCEGVGGRHFDTTTTIVDNNSGATEDTTIIPRTITSLSLSEFGAVFTANMMPLDGITDSENIAAAGGEEVLNNAEEEEDGFDTMILSVNSPNRPFKGALIRVEPKITADTTTQAEKSIVFTLGPDNNSNSNNAQLLPSHLCSTDATAAFVPQAVTHKNNLPKTNISAKLRTTTAAASTETTTPPIFYIDVVIVEANNDTHSIYAQSRYELRLEKESATETSTEAPTVAPTTEARTSSPTPIDEPEVVIDYCQICGPNAEMANPNDGPVFYDNQEYTCGEMLLTVGPTLPAITTQDCQLAIAATAAANCRCIPIIADVPATEAPTATPTAAPTSTPTTTPADTTPTPADTPSPVDATPSPDTSTTCTVCPNGVLSNGNAQVTLQNGTSVPCAQLPERLEMSEDCNTADDVCRCSTTSKPTSSPTIDDSSTTTITIPKCNPPCMDVQQPTNVISIVEADTQFSCLEVYNDLTPLLQIGVVCEDAQNRIKYHCGCIGPIAAQTTNNSNRDISSALHTRRTTTSSFTALLLATTTILFWFFLERS